MQAVCVLAEDYTVPAVAMTFGLLDASTALSCAIPESRTYLAVDPLVLSRILDPQIVRPEHYRVARGVQEMLQRYDDMQDIIVILGIDEQHQAGGEADAYKRAQAKIDFANAKLKVAGVT